LPNKRNTFRYVINLLFKRLFAFFLFRIRRHGVLTSTVVCPPGDIYHWRNWLSGKASAAEAATVVPGYWWHNYAPESQLDPVHTPTSLFLKIHLNYYPPSYAWVLQVDS
jgi:hypothetical protein